MSDSTISQRYQTKEFGDTDIRVRTLRDNQQFFDNDDVVLKLGISSVTDYRLEAEQFLDAALII